MRVGNFSVLIRQGIERESGYVEVPPGTQYSVQLGNHHHGPCDAEVEVDGKPVGAFRLASGERFAIERPVHDSGRFTFYAIGTEESRKAGEADISADNRGLIKVRFRPGRMQMAVRPISAGRGPDYDSGEFYMKSPPIGGSHGIGTDSLRSMPQNSGSAQPTSGTLGFASSPGITGLSGRSSQIFNTVEALEYDVAGETLISLRLVAPSGGPRPLTAAPAVLSNPVPPAI